MDSLDMPPGMEQDMEQDTVQDTADKDTVGSMGGYIRMVPLPILLIHLPKMEAILDQKRIVHHFYNSWGLGKGDSIEDTSTHTSFLCQHFMYNKDRCACPVVGQDKRLV
ncbi:hypothetical protein [Falsibacillus pallidus]|uniref:hypothetical protein n=1 Tax=Falsibacillus pallidus TaxID=493781 RepID=UPI001313EE0C|nr:hypothetical protein [Falsibacillus pallidus]